MLELTSVHLMQFSRMPCPDVSRLAKFNTHHSLKLLLLLGRIHDFPDHKLYIMEIHIIATNVLNLPLDEIRVHEDILGQ